MHPSRTCRRSQPSFRVPNVAQNPWIINTDGAPFHLRFPLRHRFVNRLTGADNPPRYIYPATELASIVCLLENHILNNYQVNEAQSYLGNRFQLTTKSEIFPAYIDGLSVSRRSCSSAAKWFTRVWTDWKVAASIGKGVEVVVKRDECNGRGIVARDTAEFKLGVNSRFGKRRFAAPPLFFILLSIITLLNHILTVQNV
jgi:hypothetical protein